MKTTSSILFGAFALFIAVPAQAVVQYTVADLGILPGYATCYPLGINTSGQIAGYCYSSTTGYHSAFLYDNGTMIGLGTLGGSTSEARDINTSGQVVGWAKTSTGVARAFIYSNNVMSDIGTLGGPQSSAACINSNGEVAGWADLGNGLYHAFLYNNGTMRNLGTLIGDLSSYATGINSNGQVVGCSFNTTTNFHGFTYGNGIMVELPALPGDTCCFPADINDGGAIVGYSYDSTRIGHAFLYENGTMTALGSFGGTASYATAINSHGDVVGYSYATAPGDIRAFIYRNGEMLDLNSMIDSSLGWKLQDAQAITENGWIVGCGRNPAGQYHAYLLSPIPEPSTLALIGMGCIGLIAFAWRRRKAHRIVVCFIAMLCSTAGMARAVTIDLVPVGNINNAADSNTGNLYGAVDHAYAIGKYEVTAGQYCEFLNAKAQTDTYGLYNANMWSIIYGCKIQQTGSSGSYAYSVATDYANRLNGG